MDFQNEARIEALLEQANKRRAVDSGAVETLNALQDAVAVINGTLEHFLERFGLTLGRFQLLVLLMDQDKEGLLPSDLAERARITRATVTGLLDGLQRDGLVRRTRDRGDRRTSTVRLTPVAYGVLEGVLNEYYRKVGRWLSGVSGGGRRTLVGVLSTITERLGEQEDDRLPL